MDAFCERLGTLTYLPVRRAAAVYQKQKHEYPERRLWHKNSSEWSTQSSPKVLTQKQYWRRLSAPALNTQRIPSVSSFVNAIKSSNKSSVAEQRHSHISRVGPLPAVDTRYPTVRTNIIPGTGFRLCLIFFFSPDPPSALCTVLQKYDDSRSSRSARGGM